MSNRIKDINYLSFCVLEEKKTFSLYKPMKNSEPRDGANIDQWGHNLNNQCRGPIGDAKY